MVWYKYEKHLRSDGQTWRGSVTTRGYIVVFGQETKTFFLLLKTINNNIHYTKQIFFDMAKIHGLERSQNKQNTVLCYLFRLSTTIQPPNTFNIAQTREFAIQIRITLILNLALIGLFSVFWVDE